MNAKNFLKILANIIMHIKIYMLLVQTIEDIKRKRNIIYQTEEENGYPKKTIR